MKSQGSVPHRFQEVRPVSSRLPRHVRIAIVGAGFAGLGMAIRLRQEGIDDFIILERADEVGGVWRDNVYPGCACDVQSLLYSFSFAPNPGWSRAYAPAWEIQAYLLDCVRRFHLEPFLRFGHAVLSAKWDVTARRWVLETPHGVLTADVFVAAVGTLSEPVIPPLPGLERFRGKVMHSARWDVSYALAGRQVGVVGTGASAAQIVPAIQPEVGRLVLFQRTPAWVLPRGDKPNSALRKALYRWVPGARWLLREALRILRDGLALGFQHPWIFRFAQRGVLWHMLKGVKDPSLRDRLTPRYTMGCKRILVSDDYLPALTRPNVQVVTAPIREVREDAVVTGDGAVHPVDTLIFGTGFQATDMPLGHHLQGRDGRTLAQVWAGSPRAFLGTTVSGFPNLFLLEGPHTTLGHTSVLLMMEAQVEHVLGALRYLEARGAAAVEPDPRAQDAFVRDLEARLSRSVWSQGGCRSWYMDASGRNSALWPGSTTAFRHRVEHFEPSDYVTLPRAGVPLTLRP
ncbi:NAD(P)/FAD-dependent oxidoreductase [Corallococcus aberystwythensis]|uniref:NAD(P)/FAD-dependent oxidoreductase n=1 Tax=Corallococcus aberystwythensis TaxID=2316722 RepID=A0A3A8Q664_9BACT|nr:NAD(P)/FAD-dependent oxidoreductase [Corallococcus aberystwythensis]